MKGIKENKLIFRNKMSKAFRLKNVDDTDLIVNVNEDFLGDAHTILKDYKSMCDDYISLHKFYEGLDIYRKDKIQLIQTQKEEEINLMIKEYNTLLEDYNELLFKYNELVEFKKLFTNKKKITDDLQQEILKLRAEGLSYKKISIETGVNTCTISKIINGTY